MVKISERCCRCHRRKKAPSNNYCRECWAEKKREYRNKPNGIKPKKKKLGMLRFATQRS